MAYEKITIGVLASVDTQGTDTTLRVGGSSAGGVLTMSPNLFAGHRFWDSCAVTLEAPNNDAVFNVTVHGNVLGTSFPIARRTLASAVDGVTVLTNTCATSAMPTPTAVEFDYSSGNGMTASVIMMGKALYGKVKGQAVHSGMEKVVEAKIAQVGTNVVGSSDGGLTNWVVGVTGDTNVTMLAGQSTLAVGEVWAIFGGLDRMDFWDHCNYYFNCTGASGNWRVAVEANINGSTYFTNVAQCTLGAATTAAGVTRIGLTSAFNGPSPKPSRVVFDLTNSGVSAQIQGSLYAIAKASKGRRSKI